MSHPRFGPAGNAESFRAMGYRHTIQVPEYLERKGLDAYEYQCGRGVRISQEAAAQLGEEARKRGISLSVHAPYYISLSSLEEEKREKSIDYILQTARAAKAMGAERIVVHTGSCSKISREEALELAAGTLARAVEALRSEGLDSVHICPETMGKINQLGTLEEVVELCSRSESLIPCIDFGHLNARTLGGLGDFAAVQHIFTLMEDRLGTDRMRRFHGHFSKIEYTKGGEKAHLTFSDRQFGPAFEPVAEMILRKGCTPTIICESAGTQAEDAAWMQQLCRKMAGGQAPRLSDDWFFQREEREQQ